MQKGTVLFFLKLGPSPFCKCKGDTILCPCLVGSAPKDDTVENRQGQGIMSPKVNLEGKTPSNGRREDPAALPPFLGRGMKPRPSTKGATPPWIPLERLPVASHGASSPLVIYGQVPFKLT